MDIKEAVFIIPYFGKFNNYFQLFLNSCSYNEKFDWLIFTDDKTKYIYPDNVKVIYCTFLEIQNKFKNKFDFDISLERPYKLCDFKPTYGYVFYDLIKDYRFWGHCDTDIIWGKIDNFITSDAMDKYDKIGILGHCTLYRNTYENNTSFLKKLDGVNRAKEVLMSSENNSFDEEFNSSINNIFESLGKEIDYSEYEANIYTKSSDFRVTRLDLKSKEYQIEKKKKAYFLWNNGRLQRYIYNNGNVYKKEYMYIHMQSRKMNVRNTKFDMYKIIPNAFENIEISNNFEKNFGKVKIKNFNLHYFTLRTRNLYLKLKKLIKGIKFV